MVLDASAIVAILFHEPDADRFGETLAAALLCLISAVTRVELLFEIEGRKRDAGRRDPERLLHQGGFEVVLI